MTLDKNLIHLCKVRGLTLAALAKESGVKQPTLHGWTTGRSVQNLDDLKKVCDVLKITLHCILYGEKDPWEEVCKCNEVFKKVN
ncbi:MAG: helix-turn-helix transcriptional regulator [Bdellovibrionales bacterium]|nr:helix-turn-helix transcriptional regulator [Bdellovibrionales bacterium]